MVRRSLWGILVLLWTGVMWSPASAGAQGEISTIYLREGGKVRGEIVIDIPGRPLTVQVGGQTLELARESIERIEAETAAPAPAAAPVAAAPAPAPAPMVAATPPAQATPEKTVLTVDRRGRAEIDPNWSPEVKSLVLHRNETTRELASKGYTGPIVLAAAGAGVYLFTAIASRVAFNSFEDCLNEEVQSLGDLDECKDRSVPIARAGYFLGTGLVVGGSIFFWTRWARRHRLQMDLNRIDMDLRQLNVVPLAARDRNGWVGGAALRATF